MNNYDHWDVIYCTIENNLNENILKIKYQQFLHYHNTRKKKMFRIINKIHIIQITQKIFI